ncbi:MAG: hypothetical protein U0354_18195 [Candidatus Sericytochromatia bacterium]
MKKISLSILLTLLLTSCGNVEQQLNNSSPLISQQNVTSLSNKKMSKNQFTEKLASKLHDIWREPRKKSDGSYEPRLKDTKDEKWIKSHNKQQVDIANTNYENLPEDWKKENRESALVATNIVFKAVANKTNMDYKFIEESSASIHSEWLKRNTWAKGGELDVPYSKLIEVEKAKDRNIIKLAIALKTVDDAEI